MATFLSSDHFLLYLRVEILGSNFDSFLLCCDLVATSRLQTVAIFTLFSFIQFTVVINHGPEPRVIYGLKTIVSHTLSSFLVPYRRKEILMKWK